MIILEGIASADEGSARHMLFADVDGGELDDLADLCARLARRHRLPDLLIRESSPGHYHVVSGCARGAAEIVVMQQFLGCDPLFVEVGRRRGFWMLRTSARDGVEVETIAVVKTGRRNEENTLWKVRYEKVERYDLSHWTAHDDC